ncbi:MAG: hypothetical protein V9G19_23875 [Tetrasphaera sp.]
MSRRQLATVMATSALTLGVCAPIAQAAAPDPAATARLSGTFSVSGTVTQSVNGDPVGMHWVRPFRFTPTCTSGSCATRLTRTRGDGVVVKYLLNPNSTGTYTGTHKYVASCFLSGGGTVPKAYTYTETTTITQKRVVAGSIATFTGTLRLSAKPTAIGQAHNCRPGNETIALSGKR